MVVFGGRNDSCLEKECGSRNGGMMSEGFPLVWLVVIVWGVI